MKIISLIIFALAGFWIMSAIIDHFRRKAFKAPAPSSVKSDQRTEAAFPEIDPVAQACHTLELDQPFTADQLRDAYRRQISKYHPDRMGHLGHEFQELAEKKSRDINQAYDFLSRRQQ